MTWRRRGLLRRAQWLADQDAIAIVHWYVELERAHESLVAIRHPHRVALELEELRWELRSVLNTLEQELDRRSHRTPSDGPASV